MRHPRGQFFFLELPQSGCDLILINIKNCHKYFIFFSVEIFHAFPKLTGHPVVELLITGRQDDIYQNNYSAIKILGGYFLIFLHKVKVQR